MPDRDDLPPALYGLQRRNAVRLDHATFRTDVVRLIDAVASTPPAVRPSTMGRVQQPAANPVVDRAPRPSRPAAPTSVGRPIDVTDASFARVLQNTKPVLVEFWAEWCGPSKLLAPVLAEIAAEHADELVVAKLDIDRNPGTSRDFKIMAIPTLIVFRRGLTVKEITGAKPKAALLRDLAEFLG